MKKITIEIVEIHDDPRCPNTIYWKVYRWYKLFGILVFRKLFGTYDSFEYMDCVVAKLMRENQVTVL